MFHHSTMFKRILHIFYLIFTGARKIKNKEKMAGTNIVFTGKGKR
jgi:hypothetical protein